MKPIDTIEETGLFDLSSIPYDGNFTIKYHSREQLQLLQEFFGVRRFKFDMNLLEKRPEIAEELEGFKWKS